MKKRRTEARRQISIFGIIGLMNLCVLGMFVAILFPDPPSASHEPVASAVRRIASQSKLPSISLGIPTRVVVPSVAIDLPVRLGSYDVASQTWTLDTSSAFYADRSVPANSSNGSTLVYGHAQQGLFARLPEITDGATAQVYTDSGKVFSYTFQSARQVTPDDTSIFSNTGAPMLALQTCSGPFDTYRTLVVFNLTKVEPV